MKVLIAGSTGFIGKALTKHLESCGDVVFGLTRGVNDSEKKMIHWDPYSNNLSPKVFENIDAVINLVGENVASGYWSKTKKKHLLDSRIRSTDCLLQKIREVKNKPKIFISVSAIGYYGDCGDRIVDESSSSSDTFLSQICQKWEQSASVANELGMRLVIARLGVVLSKEGGPLGKMLLPFKFGLGGKVGDGEQYMSWIAMKDVLNAFDHFLREQSSCGIYNVVSPTPVSNITFTKTLGKILNRPTILPLPKFMVKLLMGEMGESILLSSAKVMPRKLLDESFHFEFSDIKIALKDMLG